MWTTKIPAVLLLIIISVQSNGHGCFNYQLEEAAATVLHHSANPRVRSSGMEASSEAEAAGPRWLGLSSTGQAAAEAGRQPRFWASAEEKETVSPKRGKNYSGGSKKEEMERISVRAKKARGLRACVAFSSSDNLRKSRWTRSRWRNEASVSSREEKADGEKTPFLTPAPRSRPGAKGGSGAVAHSLRADSWQRPSDARARAHTHAHTHHNTRGLWRTRSLLER